MAASSSVESSAHIAEADKMSDNEEFLGEDFGDPSADDTYNLGNEEEEILLAGGNIPDSISRDEIKSTDVQNEKLHNVYSSNNSVAEVNNICDPQSYLDRNVQNSIDDGVNTKKLSNDEEITPLNENITNSRYRADQKERFPTERSESHGVNLAKIPDSLDTVVTAEPVNQSFRNRKQNNNRGKRINNQRSMNDFKRNDFQRSQNFNNRNDNFGRNVHNSRGPPPDFRLYPRDSPMNRNGPIPPLMHNFHPNDYSMSNNSGFRPGPDATRFGDMRPVEPRPGNFRHENNRSFHNMNPCPNIGPNNNRPLDTHSSGPPMHRDFRSMPPSNPRNFDQFHDNLPHPSHNNAEFRPFDKQYNDRFMPRIGNVNNFGPPNISGPVDDKALHPGHLHSPKVHTNVMLGYNDKKNDSNENFRNNFNQPPNQYKTDMKIAANNESKKVLINPHFKGPVPTDIPSERPSTLNNYPSFGNSVSNVNSANYIPNRPQESLHYRTREPDSLNSIGYNNQPVNEKELERLTEQFIQKQQVCFRKNDNDDFYEKTQRFIENTSLPNRNISQSFSSMLDPKKEYLKRKQEEFIHENTKLLNLRRHKNSPPRSVRRSPPPSSRHRISPYKRPRGRSSVSPTHGRREQSGEPEDKAYRAKLREQAEMRAKVLQAKERRRRRDAANLLDKMSQSSPAPLSPKSDKAETSSSNYSNDKKPENDYQVLNKINNDEAILNKNIPDKRDVESDQKPVNNPIVEDKNDTKTSEKPVINKQSTEDTFDDMLEDDLLHLSPEDEELLLSDEDDLILPINFSKPANTNFKNSETKSSDNESFNKNPSKSATVPHKSLIGNKRLLNIDEKEDLRTKLKKSNENNEDKSSNTQSASPRRKIIFSNDSSKESENNRDDKAVGGDKWRSTFSEQKLDLTAPVAARAIAVMRNNKKTPTKNEKSSNLQNAVDLESEKKSNRLQNGSDAKSWNGRQVVVAKPTRRVVIPPRQKPLVVIENDEEEESEESHEQVIKNSKNKKTALVTGLPPGMTEARLLSLCGPEVEHVSVGAAGNADVSFNSTEACERFIRRFHGRLVAACRLTVTAAN